MNSYVYPEKVWHPSRGRSSETWLGVIRTEPPIDFSFLTAPPIDFSFLTAPPIDFSSKKRTPLQISPIFLKIFLDHFELRGAFGAAFQLIKLMWRDLGTIFEPVTLRYIYIYIYICYIWVPKHRFRLRGAFGAAMKLYILVYDIYVTNIPRKRAFQCSCASICLWEALRALYVKIYTSKQSQNKV